MKKEDETLYLLVLALFNRVLAIPFASGRVGLASTI
jgi:hypothetical protein